MDRFDPDAIVDGLKQLCSNPSYSHQVLAGMMDDDCAVSTGVTGHIVATTDFLNYSPICVELGIGNLGTLGKLAIASSLSDLAGSGAEPRFVLTAVGLPADAMATDYWKIMDGVISICKEYDVACAGGDSKIMSKRTLLSVGIGIVGHQDELFTLTGAKAGDILWSSGNLGSVAAAVIALTEKTCPDLESWAAATLTEPSIPLKMSRQLALARLGRGGTDVSDGLGADLSRLCKRSGLGAMLDLELIPIHKNVERIARESGFHPVSFAFASGGDYQFLVTTKPDSRETLKGLGFIEMGVMTDTPGILIKCNDNLRQIPAYGHRDFGRTTFQDLIRRTCEDATTVLR